jgi:predicted NACHT family NTPase
MGNSLNFAEYVESEGPGEEVSFFRLLKLKQLRSVFAQLQEARISDFDVNNVDETISWRTYFHLFSTIKEKFDKDAELHTRSQWHTATMGYEMTVQERVDEVVEETGAVSTVKDDWTDDDLSDDDAGDGGAEHSMSSQAETEKNNSLMKPSNKDVTRRFSVQDESGERGESNSAGGSGSYSYSRREGESSTYSSSSVSIKKPKPNMVKSKNWDPMYTSPIFFGYSSYKTAEKMEVQAVENERNKIAEERAIATAQESRVLFIDEFEKAVKNQESVRVKKIFDLETKYNTAHERAIQDYDRSERDLPELAFKTWKVCT